MKKQVLESYMPFDMSQLIKYRKGNKINVILELGFHQVKVKLDLENLIGQISEELITLEKSSCGYGGYRYWLLCPGCKNRYRILYLKDCLTCRKCGKLTYASQQRTKTDCSYHFQKAIAIAKKLDPEYNEEKDFFHSYRFPNRPKNIRISTYVKLRREFMIYVGEGNRVWLDYVSWRYRK